MTDFAFARDNPLSLLLGAGGWPWVPLVVVLVFFWFVVWCFGSFLLAAPGLTHVPRYLLSGSLLVVGLGWACLCLLCGLALGVLAFWAWQALFSFRVWH